MSKHLAVIYILLFSSCGFYYIDSTGERRRNKDAQITMPFGHKKAKKNIRPSIEFVEALKSYRLRVGIFPANMQQFEYYNEKSKKAVNGMRELGFKKMDVSYSYLDSMIIDFVHDPIYTQKIGTTDLRFHVNGEFIFTIKDSLFFNVTKIK